MAVFFPFWWVRLLLLTVCVLLGEPKVCRENVENKTIPTVEAPSIT